ncbi:MAG: hypothetical protein GY940_38835, partial [bacterium]|nr:hypothetical protein [bacterium]
GYNPFQNSQYAEIKTLCQAEHDFINNGNFQYSGTYTPQPVFPGDWYRMKLEVTAPNGVKEKLRYKYFYYSSSRFSVSPGFIRKEDGKKAAHLVPGETYHLRLSLNNPVLDWNRAYDVKNGNFDILLESPSGQEIYRKSMTGITMVSGETQTIDETFIFQPAEMGTYYLKYRGWDETKDEPQNYFVRQALPDGTEISIQPGKYRYNYADTAAVTVHIGGAGPYNLSFSCPEAGILEERTIQVPGDTYHTSEIFQVPIGFNSPYHTEVEVRDAAGRETRKQFTLYRNPLAFDYTGNFSEPFARAGGPLAFEMNINGQAGFTNPLVGELSLSAPGFNYQDTRTVTLQPGIDNPFSYTIPLALEVPAGTHGLDVEFKVENKVFIAKHHSILLPEAGLTFLEPAETTYNAGDSISLNLENNGGKAGTFQLSILLRDTFGKTMAEVHETRTLSAGGGESLVLALPGTLKSGRYLLVQSAKETTQQEELENSFPVQVTGLSATLNSYTPQEKYFDFEMVTGKSGITLGNGALA